MKTAMQELLTYILVDCRNESGTIQFNAHETFNKFLEKEKEQIIDAGNACSIKSMVHREKLDEMSEDELRNSLVEDTISYGEEYYNQTYNQNK
jgi:hypothetical protein